MTLKTLAKTLTMMSCTALSLAVLSYASMAQAALRTDVTRELDNCEKKAIAHLQQNLNQVAQLSGSNELANLTVVDVLEKKAAQNLTVYEIKVLRTNQLGEPVGCLAKLHESGLEMNRPNALEICAVSYKAWASKNPQGECSLDNIKPSDSSGIRGF